MDSLLPVPEMVWDGDLSENWERFYQRFEMYIGATGNAAKADKVKCNMLLMFVTAKEQGRKVFNNFTFAAEEDNRKLETVVGKFQKYCCPKRNEAFERYKFLSRKQREFEKFDDFVRDIRTLSNTCGFADKQDSLIRDIIVMNTNSESLRRKLLKTENLTLENAIQMGKLDEEADRQAQDMKPSVPRGDVVHSIDRVPLPERGIPVNTRVPFRHVPSQPSTSRAHTAYQNKQSPAAHTPSRNNTRHVCHRCNRSHPPMRCPAFNQICDNCNRRGHFASCCRSRPNNRRINEVKEEQVQHLEGQFDEQLYIESVCNTNANNDWLIDVTTSHNKQFTCKVDTGAQANVMSLGVFQKLYPHRNMLSTNVKLSNYSNGNIPVIGKYLVNIEFQQQKHCLTFYIVNINSTTIIGLKAARLLKLVRNIDSVNTNASYENLMNEYDDIFNGLGCIATDYKIRLDPNVVPVNNKARNVPFALRSKLKDELQRMQRVGIILNVDEPTEWVNSIVIVEKSDGTIRVCLDPKTLNNAILREHYSIPTRDDLVSEFAGAKYFSKLDATTAFHQIKLDDESSRYCTFNTPFGRFRYLRMPYGISSASEVFHREVRRIYENIEGVNTSMDDMIIWGRTRQEHDERLKNVLEVTRKANLKLNKKKCIFGVTSIKFMGDILSSEGLKADPDKVKAIKGLAAPSTKTELQSFLGMVNYLGRFVPDLTKRTVLMRELTKNKIEWHWSREHTLEFENLKQLISSTPVLKFFDPSLPIKVSADASSYGLGAVLLQKHENEYHPVAYASRAMTETEKKYAQIEKETLAIVFAMEKFHQYVYGQHFVMETDHKPLVTLFDKDLSKCPLRIQRFIIRLQKYTFSLSYMPGKFLHTADALSRSSMMISTIDAADQRLEESVKLATAELPLSSRCQQQIRDFSNDDDELVAVKHYVKNGWPAARNLCRFETRPYYAYAHELTIVNDILFKGTQFVIPKSLRKSMLEKIHEGHLGEIKCKTRARELVFWPGMSHDIENIVSSCPTCTTYRNKHSNQPINSQNIPDFPFQIVGSDLFVFNGEIYIIVVDYFSCYPEVILLGKDASSRKVINSLKPVFARFGIPLKLITDNGPQYSSHEFKQFAEEWDFIHKTSSPRYAKGNALAERAVQTMKNLLKKAKASGQDFNKSLLVYRSTPLQCGLSPSQLLMHRRIRNNLPVNNSSLHFSTSSNTRNIDAERQKQKFYHDRTSRDLSILTNGAPVRLYNFEKEDWSLKGTVVEMVSPRSYLVRCLNGATYRRNRVHLRKDKSCYFLYNAPVDSSNSVSVTKCNPTLRRSSRVVRKPERLIETM